MTKKGAGTKRKFIPLSAAKEELTRLPTLKI
jgi:hypothetical protein